MSDVTAVLPIKGKSDLQRFNKILKPSLLDVYDLNLILITDEKIDDSNRIKVINDDLVFRSVNDARNSRGWFKQQVIKLKSWKYVDTEWMLILDADCFFLFQGSINNLFKNGKPIVSYVKDIKNQKWWLNSSKNINVELPSDGFCAVTPMFLNTKICKDLDQKYDLEELIYKHNCTEYSLYWLYGLKKGINWSEMYSFGNLLNVAIWYKVDNSTEKTFQYFEDLLVKSKLVEPKMGLMQSNINFEESTDQIINKIIELLNIHKR